MCQMVDKMAFRKVVMIQTDFPFLTNPGYSTASDIAAFILSVRATQIVFHLMPFMIAALSKIFNWKYISDKILISGFLLSPHSKVSY